MLASCPTYPQLLPLNAGMVQEPDLGHTPRGSYTSKGCSKHLLENPILRTPSENTSENPTSLYNLLQRYLSKKPLRTFCKALLRTPSKTSHEPFLEACVLLRTLQCAPNNRNRSQSYSPSPGAKSRSGTVGTVFQESKPEPELCLKHARTPSPTKLCKPKV